MLVMLPWHSPWSGTGRPQTGPVGGEGPRSRLRLGCVGGSELHQYGRGATLSSSPEPELVRIRTTLTARGG